MSLALETAGSVELAFVERSGLVESRHLGAAAVVDGDGAPLVSLGDTKALIYPRSSLKLLQAVAVLRSGAPLKPLQAVLAAASHAGTERHVEVVRSTLSAAGLDESALQCPPRWPGDRATHDELVRSGGTASAVHSDCSGKHAAFLLACQHNGWPTASYLNPAHPLQQLIRSTIEELAGTPLIHSGVDGCGAPVHAVGLYSLALSTSRIAGPGADATSAFLAAAIRANGWGINGADRADTLAIERLGLVAKRGAEGVMVMGSADGTAVAVKILDGSMRAGALVALELLVSVGAIERSGADEVIDATSEPVLGGGERVGAIRPSFRL